MTSDQTIDVQRLGKTERIELPSGAVLHTDTLRIRGEEVLEISITPPDGEDHDDVGPIPVGVVIPASNGNGIGFVGAEHHGIILAASTLRLIADLMEETPRVLFDGEGDVWQRGSDGLWRLPHLDPPGEGCTLEELEVAVGPLTFVEG